MRKNTKFSRKQKSEQFLKKALSGFKGVLRDLPKIDLAVDRLTEVPARCFEKGEYIFREGDRWTDWYVINTGAVRLQTRNKDRKRVELGPGECFGELAILYNCRRPATAIALQDSTIFHINGMIFKELFLKPSPKVAQFIKTAPLFKRMNFEDRRLLSRQLSMVRYKPGDVITREGDKPKAMFVVYEGEVDTVNDEKKSLWGLVKGQHFGARPYTLGKRHQFTTIASKNGTTVLRFDFPALRSQSGMEFWDILRKIPGVDTDERVEPALPQENEKDLKIVDVSTLAETKHYSSFKPQESKVLISNRDEEELTRLWRKYKRRDKDPSDNRKDIDFASLELCGVLGKGSYGVVQLMYDQKEDETYARKRIPKKKLDKDYKLLHVLWEKEVMLRLDSQFIVRLFATNEDRENIYFYMEPVLGGGFFSLLQEHVMFSEKPHAIFYAGCVVSALEHIHSKKIVFRDLKPENLLIDINGYLKLCDFGFAKIIHDRSFSMLGTPEYLAPEMFGNRGHDRAYDWWTFGVFIFEILNGQTPFYDDDQHVVKSNIKNVRYEFGFGWSKAVTDLIKRLLVFKPENRLGMSKKHGEGVGDHAWFKSLDWRRLRDRSLKPPIMPKVRNNKDLSNFKIEEQEDNLDHIM